MPDLHIITGSNGAGKSTVGQDYLPVNIRNNCEIFNGDKVFQDKKRVLWLQGIRAIKESRKIASDFVNSSFDFLRYSAMSKLEDFCYEGHFTNEATWDVPREFKNAGYSIPLKIFLV